MDSATPISYMTWKV